MTDSAWPPWMAPPDRLDPGSGTQAVVDALGWLETLGERQDWPARVRLALTLCADEALANVVRHARTPAGEPARMWLACGPTPDGWALCVEDDGTSFDPTGRQMPPLAPSLDDARVGGHGLRLMRHYLHRLLHRREGDRNVLLLEVAR